jgi:hypothetical protein
MLSVSYLAGKPVTVLYLRARPGSSTQFREQLADTTVDILANAANLVD